MRTQTSQHSRFRHPTILFFFFEESINDSFVSPYETRVSIFLSRPDNLAFSQVPGTALPTATTGSNCSTIIQYLNRAVVLYCAIPAWKSTVPDSTTPIFFLQQRHGRQARTTTMAASEEYLNGGAYGGRPQQLCSDHGTGDSSSSSRDGIDSDQYKYGVDSDADGSSDSEHSPGDGAGGFDNRKVKISREGPRPAWDWQLHAVCSGWAAVEEAMSEIMLEQAAGGKLLIGTANPNDTAVTYMYHCPFKYKLRCQWTFRVRIHAPQGNPMFACKAAGRAAFHAQHECRVEIARNRPHADHRAVQIKGPHLYFCCMAGNDSNLLRLSRNGIASWFLQHKVQVPPGGEKAAVNRCKKWAEKQSDAKIKKVVGDVMKVNTLGTLWAVCQLQAFETMVQHADFVSTHHTWYLAGAPMQTTQLTAGVGYV